MQPLLFSSIETHTYIYTTYDIAISHTKILNFTHGH